MVEFTHEQVTVTLEKLEKAGSVPTFSGRAHALGKRANIVSEIEANKGHKDSLRARSRRLDAQESQCKRGQGRQKLISLEKDQPLHVRLRAARLRQYQMQDTAARLAGTRLTRKNRLRQDRVSDCRRTPTDMAECIEGRYNPKTEVGYTAGLQTCGSVWHCPLCASEISEKRRDQLSLLVNRHLAAGGSVWMTTYTVSHRRCTDLESLVANFLEARRKMRQGRRGMALREDFQIVGTVSVLEVTWSPRNGWHPHVHELVFSMDKDMDPVAYDKAVRPVWKEAAGKMGLSMNVHGFQIDKTWGAVQDYILKFGHEPKNPRPWGTESEMVKGHIKQARNDDGMTPFGLLAAITDGLEKYTPLWQEYCRVFKGRKQLNFSSGLKKLYELEENEDVELVEENGEGKENDLTLVELTHDQWGEVVKAKARGGFNELLRTGRPGEVIAGLAEIGIDASPPDMRGWRVQTPGGEGEVDLVRADQYAPGGWRAWVYLDGSRRRLRMYALWDLKVLGSGEAEREALLAETG